MLDIDYSTLEQYAGMGEVEESGGNDEAAEDTAANEAMEQEQAALFAGSLANMQGLATGAAVDADGDVTMG